MNGLLQRLAAQALGAPGPRVRSAVTVQAQSPIALPSRGQRDEGHGASALDGAASRTTLEPAPTTPRDDGADARREPEIVLVEPRPREAEGPQQIDDATTDLMGADAARKPIAPSLATPLPAPMRDLLATHPASASIRPALPRQPQPGPHREPTEVHVHIGRIEVTALPATAEPKQRERPARPSVPLSDYLSKRRSS
jgi:hypothetical protein